MRIDSQNSLIKKAWGMILNLTNISAEPLYLQISRQIKQRILNGDLTSGSKLFPVGIFAKQHHINKASIIKAYNKLKSEGLIQHNGEDEFYVNNFSTEKLDQLREENSLSEWSLSQSKRIQDELKTARQIQKNLLPKELPSGPDFILAAFYSPAEEVSGDFYDFLKNENSSFGLVIGDASGKGMPAAMLTLQIQAILKSDKNNERSMHQTLEILNDYLYNNTHAKHFATLFLGKYNRQNGNFEYVNAGHNLPILLRQNGSIEFLETTGPALGIMKQSRFIVKMINLQKDDSLVFYTDGVTETMNSKKELFGEERLIKVIKDNSEKMPTEILNSVMDRVKKFNNSGYKEDDITLIILKRI